MTTTDKSAAEPIGPHDLGGAALADEDAAVEPAAHDGERAHWERQIDAVIYVLRQKGVMTDTAQLRTYIEETGPGVYENLGYYERWAVSVEKHCVARGLVTEDEIATKVAEIRARETGA